MLVSGMAGGDSDVNVLVDAASLGRELLLRKDTQSVDNPLPKEQKGRSRTNSSRSELEILSNLDF
jgi:hypothetical protein